LVKSSGDFALFQHGVVQLRWAGCYRWVPGDVDEVVAKRLSLVGSSQHAKMGPIGPQQLLRCLGLPPLVTLFLPFEFIGLAGGWRGEWSTGDVLGPPKDPASGPFVVPLDDGANKAPATPDGQTAKRGFLFPGPARTARDGWIASGATAEAWGRGQPTSAGRPRPPPHASFYLFRFCAIARWRSSAGAVVAAQSFSPASAPPLP
jgi:hypothetical protein